uniref:BTB domain-containing protein n=1 Tax=Gouania willdenowi TaxID=441366 RepID=A0A8C5HB38_GOUWI
MPLVCFPGARVAVLDNLNRQREEGRLCDLSIHVQGRVFRAHRCVLAASSPYFHDQVQLSISFLIFLTPPIRPTEESTNDRENMKYCVNYQIIQL